MGDKMAGEIQYRKMEGNGQKKHLYLCSDGL